MKPIKNIRNNEKKPSLIKLSNEEDDRPLLNIKGKNENSLILPSTANNTSNKSKLLRNHFSIDNNNGNKENTFNFNESRNEVDEFFFDSLPDISNTNVNQITSKKKVQQQRPSTSLSATFVTENTKNSNEIINNNNDNNNNNGRFDKFKREKMERDLDNKNTNNDNNRDNNNNNNSTSNKNQDRTKFNQYEENEEWLMKNTDKLLRNLFDRQKKWENARNEIQGSIEKIKKEENESPENKELTEKEKQQRENKRKIEIGLNKIKKLDEILEQKYKYEKELKEKGSSNEFLSETEKQFLMKYDIEVPSTLLKDEVLKKQKELNGQEENDGEEEDKEDNKDNNNRKKLQYSSFSSSRPVLRREDGSTNLLMLDDHNRIDSSEIDGLSNDNENNYNYYNYNYNDNDDNSAMNDNNNNNNNENKEEEEEEEFFQPTRQNIIKKVADFSTENKKDKDRLKALFSNKTFLTETKSLPISLFISKPDIDDIDIDLDDDPELLQLKLEQENFKNDNISKKIFEKELDEQENKEKISKKQKNSKNGFKGNFIKRNIQLGGDARYYYALTDEEKLRLEAILQLPDEELEDPAFKEGEDKTKEKEKGESEDKKNEENNNEPTEVFVNPDDYIKNDSKKTLKNGYLPTVEEFDNLKKINEKLHNLVPASEWLKRRTESDLFNASLLSNTSTINSGFWSSQDNIENNEISQISLFSNNSSSSNKSNIENNVYSTREKRETKKRMKEINERLSELQEMRNNFESEYNIHGKPTEVPKYESILDKLDMNAIEEQIKLANEKLLSMKLSPEEIEKSNLIDINLGESESILDQIDIKKMESEIEMDNQRLLKMKSNSMLDLGNIELFTTEGANAVTSISNNEENDETNSSNIQSVTLNKNNNSNNNDTITIIPNNDDGNFKKNEKNNRDVDNEEK